MKLETALPSTPGFLHALPGIDIIALVMIFPLLGSAFVQHTGMDVKVFDSSWRYEQMENAIVVTLGPGKNPQMWVNKKQVLPENLETEIKAILDAPDGNAISTVVLKTDVTVSSGEEKEVINKILGMGLNCGLVGKPPAEKKTNR